MPRSHDACVVDLLYQTIAEKNEALARVVKLEAELQSMKINLVLHAPAQQSASEITQRIGREIERQQRRNKSH